LRVAPRGHMSQRLPHLQKTGARGAGVVTKEATMPQLALHQAELNVEPLESVIAPTVIIIIDHGDHVHVIIYP